ncbi:7tm 6 domain containing protein, partial [Asbolus verrucosus]
MERFDWKVMIKMNIFSLRIIGLWPEDYEYKFTFYTLYAVISTILFINAFGILITISIFMADVDIEDTEELTLYFVGEILLHIKTFIVFYSVIFLYNVDMLIASLMVFIGAQCDILCDNLRNLRGNTTASFKKKLKQFIKHHKEILKFAENCNKFFSFILLGQFLASSTLLSLTLYRLALDENFNVKFLAHIVLVVFYMIQIFTYCWFGNEVEL